MSALLEPQFVICDVPGCSSTTMLVPIKVKSEMWARFYVAGWTLPDSWTAGPKSIAVCDLVDAQHDAARKKIADAIAAQVAPGSKG